MGVIYIHDKKIYFTHDGKKGLSLRFNIISNDQFEWIARESDIVATTGLIRYK